MVAHAVANGSTFLSWHAPKPRSVLYLDGEMPAVLMQERLRALMGDHIVEHKAPFHLLTPDLQNEPMPDLASENGQVILEPYLKGIDLIIVDNISTLCRYDKENEADSWIPVQHWAQRYSNMRKSSYNYDVSCSASASGIRDCTKARPVQPAQRRDDNLRWC